MPKNLPIPPLHSPRVWPSWLIYGVSWLIGRLPVPGIFALGRAAGALTWRFGRHRRHVTDVNLRLCFPELSDTERNTLARDVFRHVGIGVMETPMAWLNPKRDLASRFTVTGLEHIHAAQAQGRGVLLLGAHFAAFDVVAPVLGANVDNLDVMYRKHKNPVMERATARGREEHIGSSIERSDMRAALRALKAGRTLWYAPDQDYGPKVSIFAPFFGVPAATVTATAKLARFNNSPVVFLTHVRHLEEQRWTLRFHPPFENFPTGDELVDATRINEFIEAEIRKHPAQYLWVHRRFKTRPPGEARVY